MKETTVLLIGGVAVLALGGIYLLTSRTASSSTPDVTTTVSLTPQTSTGSSSSSTLGSGYGSTSDYGWVEELGTTIGSLFA